MTTLTYVLLIYRTRGDDPTPAAERTALAGHRKLQAAAAATGDLHAVAKLGDAPRAKTVRKLGDRHAVTDGPYVDSKEWLVGFYLLDCASEAEALERAHLLCPIADHAIEVRPVDWRWRP